MRIRKIGTSVPLPSGQVIDSLNGSSTTNAPSIRAVNEGLQDIYSTSEVKTNKVWINGKPIYRKVFNYNNVAISNDVQLNASLSSDASNVVVISITGIYQIGTGSSAIYRPFPTVASDGKPLQTRWSDNKIIFSGNDSWGSGSNRYIYIFVEYTKTTD